MDLACKVKQTLLYAKLLCSKDCQWLIPFCRWGCGGMVTQLKNGRTPIQLQVNLIPDWKVWAAGIHFPVGGRGASGGRLHGAHVLARTNERSLNTVTIRSDLEIFKQNSNHRYNSPFCVPQWEGKRPTWLAGQWGKERAAPPWGWHGNGSRDPIILSLPGSALLLWRNCPLALTF